MKHREFSEIATFWASVMSGAGMVIMALLCLTSCAMRASNGEFRLALLQSDYKMEFVDADGTNFTSQLDLAAFSKLEGDVAEMGYRWDPESGQISVGRAVTNLDQTGQVAAVQGIVESAVKGAVGAFLGQLSINRAAEVELERIRAAPPVEDEVPAEGEEHTDDPFTPINTPGPAPTPGRIFPGGTILPH